MNTPFQSPHLLYRSIESPEDDAFFHSISQDAQAFANSNTALLKPVSKKTSEEMRVYYADKTLLGVLICLQPPSGGSEFKIKGVSQPPPEPIPIGSIFLSKADAGQEHHRNSDIGIDIIAAYQGQGYGSEAIEWVLN